MLVKIERKKDHLTNKIVYNFICKDDGKSKLTFLLPERLRTETFKILYNYLKNNKEFQEFRQNLNYYLNNK